jgi:hypothetical protein
MAAIYLVDGEKQEAVLQDHRNLLRKTIQEEHGEFPIPGA